MDDPDGAPDRELAEARAVLFGRVFVLSQHLTRLTDAALADWDLTTRQWLLLAILFRAFPDRAPSLTDAAEVYGSSRQNVKQIALGLEARGFVRLVRDADDGRTTRIERTDRQRVFDEPEGRAKGMALFAQVFDDLSRDETLLLRDLLVRWVDALAASGRGAPRPKGGTPMAMHDGSTRAQEDP
jgi:DNA-binding MarR family transcriptional regulator